MTRAAPGRPKSPAAQAATSLPARDGWPPAGDCCHPGGPALLSLAAAAAVAAVPVSTSASIQASPVAGHVNVNDNTAGTNTIGHLTVT